ncbi:MAG: hypothetical protein RIT81_30550 [Deltaproteobacteria bacterium]
MGFVRFVVDEVHPDSGAPTGVLQRAIELTEGPDLDDVTRASVLEHLHWFDDNLATPDRFNRTTSKGFYRRAAKGISWLKDDATEHVARLFELKRTLESLGHRVTMIREARVGYVVYEDEHQVVAEPFSDTSRL